MPTAQDMAQWLTNLSFGAGQKAGDALYDALPTVQQDWTLPEDPGYRYSDVLPLATDKATGETSLAVPKMLRSFPTPQGVVRNTAHMAGDLARMAYSGVTAPYDAYTGKLQMEAPDPVTGDLQTSPEAIKRSMDLAMTAPIAGLPAAERGAVGIFGGRLASGRLAGEGVTGPKAALDLAERMEAAGASREEIYTATNKLLEGTPFAGASKGADGKWRFEIDDRGLSIKPGAGGIGSVGEHYSHPELFSAYPRIPTNDWSHLAISPRARRSGGYQHSLGIMDVSAPSAEVARMTAAHELQHAVQSREGFSRGDNASGGLLGSLLTPFSAAARKRAWNRYYKNPGEVEARNVEWRLNMSPEQRRATPPWMTASVPQEEQMTHLSLGDILSGALSGQALREAATSYEQR